MFICRTVWVNSRWDPRPRPLAQKQGARKLRKCMCRKTYTHTFACSDVNDEEMEPTLDAEQIGCFGAAEDSCLDDNEEVLTRYRNFPSRKKRTNSGINVEKTSSEYSEQNQLFQPLPQSERDQFRSDVLNIARTINSPFTHLQLLSEYCRVHNRRHDPSPSLGYCNLTTLIRSFPEIHEEHGRFSYVGGRKLSWNLDGGEMKTLQDRIAAIAGRLGKPFNTEEIRRHYSHRYRDSTPSIADFGTAEISSFLANHPALEQIAGGETPVFRLRDLPETPRNRSDSGMTMEAEDSLAVDYSDLVLVDECAEKADEGLKVPRESSGNALKMKTDQNLSEPAQAKRQKEKKEGDIVNTDEIRWRWMALGRRMKSPVENKTAVEHEKLLQNIRTIASRFNTHFHFKIFRKAYESEFGLFPVRESKRFHNCDHIRRLFASIPEIRVNANGSFFWIGKPPKMNDLDEVREKIVIVLRGFMASATAKGISKWFLKNYGESIPFANFGYKELRDLLSEHPMLEEVQGRLWKLREKPVEGAKNVKNGSDNQLSASGGSGGGDVTGKEKNDGDLRVAREPSGNALKRKMTLNPSEPTQGKRQREDEEGDVVKKEPLDENGDSNGAEALVKEEVEEKGDHHADEDKMQTDSAAERQKFLQNIRTIASRFLIPVPFGVFRETYEEESGTCLKEESLQFGYYSMAKLFAAIPEVRLDDDDVTFSWIGGHPERPDLEEVRQKIVGSRGQMSADGASGADDVTGKEKKNDDDSKASFQTTSPQSKTVVISSKHADLVNLFAEKLNEVEGRGVDVEELGAKVLKMLDEGSE